MSRNAPKAAAANTKIMVTGMLPERIKAMTKKVMKKTLAVPRSFIKKSAPIQRARKHQKIRLDFGWFAVYLR